MVQGDGDETLPVSSWKDFPMTRVRRNSRLRYLHDVLMLTRFKKKVEFYIHSREFSLSFTDRTLRFNKIKEQRAKWLSLITDY
jgi:hypothetical protein